MTTRTLVYQTSCGAEVHFGWVEDSSFCLRWVRLTDGHWWNPETGHILSTEHIASDTWAAHRPLHGCRLATL